jgi:hypothetical protein
MSFRDEEHDGRHRKEDDREHIEREWQLECVVHPEIVGQDSGARWRRGLAACASVRVGTTT